MDIWESINSRRQGDKEPFEEFQFHVERLVARLRNPITEESLVRLLIRHSNTSLRFELMHLGSNTLARLREELRTHEQFCKQIKLQPIKSSLFPRLFVSQLDGEKEEMQPNEVAAMQRKPLKCWNCDSLGHRFDECLENQRRIFCYGCGARNVFKPKCQTCNPSKNRQHPAAASKILGIDAQKRGIEYLGA